jgi:predicted enzyme related to lactoylglutathione lyase
MLLDIMLLVRRARRRAEGGLKMKARLIAVNFPSKNLKASSKFYEALTGLPAARALSDTVESYNIVAGNGVYIWLSKPFNEQDTDATAYFAVDDLDEAISAVTGAGGQKIWNEISVPIAQSAKNAYGAALQAMGVTEDLTDEWGRVQLMKDPNGCAIALVEVQPHSQIFYGIGKYGDGRLNALLHRDHQISVDLGKKLHH